MRPTLGQKLKAACNVLLVAAPRDCCPIACQLRVQGAQTLLMSSDFQHFS